MEMAILHLDLAQDKTGQILHLMASAETGRSGNASADLVVLQQHLEPGLLVRLQDVLLGMAADARGRTLMTDLGISRVLPPGTPRPSALATPAAVSPPIPPEPSGPRPIDILREPPPQQKIYVVPFTTLMVPDAVADGVFDEFVDRLNDRSGQGGTEFIILKSGTDEVGHDWLASHTYVTGELFGYVEDSGCCTTEIRAKARIHLFRPGQAAPVLNYEYPVEEMFDHDRSTLQQDRDRIAIQTEWSCI